jgi:hypothetical protein
MKRFKVEISRGPFRIHGHVQEMGQDLLVTIWGGTKPHIGAVGMAIPRPSLRDPRKWSATSSNFTFLGHKEDTLVREISEKLAAQLKRNVVVIAGIHWDDISSKEIKAIENLTKKLSSEILRRLIKSSYHT